MANIPVGLQLYTLREETKHDFIGTLRKVAELGYRAVEFAGYGGIPAKEMKQVLGDLGLAAPSSHVGLQLLDNELHQQIEYSLEIGAKYIVCPWLDEKLLQEEESFQRLMEKFARIGEEVKRSGLQFAYHNHAFEFQTASTGRPILDRMYQSVSSDLMKAELDLYWVKKGGYDPKAYLLSYKGRAPLIHVKDMADDAEGTFAEVGHGIIDYKPIFEVAEEAGVEYYIVEQDRCQRPALESVQMSIEYLKSIGIA
ncbi:Inosose dehydratase [Paenibacillus solanacearum]|uniref:Inosose dehydratase n=1 Tax=Paenibacillus solanacearum TaxID=2048548 RepID=A0A916K7X4_9BACL|nr:sugar phosphate isomerase/epimerase [Paenibacillus solanacearum]CAG7648701.1 Inosose dehydratase [Paenibacillus solanacearum]